MKWIPTVLKLPKVNEEVCFLIELNGKLVKEYGHRANPDCWEIDDDEHGSPWVGYCDCYSDDRVKFWQKLPKSLLVLPGEDMV